MTRPGFIDWSPELTDLGIFIGHKFRALNFVEFWNLRLLCPTFRQPPDNNTRHNVRTLKAVFIITSRMS